MSAVTLQPSNPIFLTPDVAPAGLRGCYVRIAVTDQTQLVYILDVLLF